MFLIRARPDTPAFIATVAVTAVRVDVTRVVVYGMTVRREPAATAGNAGMKLMTTAVVAAFAGTLLGPRMLKKITLRTVRRIIVGVLLFGPGTALAVGIV